LTVTRIVRTPRIIIVVAAVAAAALIAAGSAVAIDTMPGASTKPVVAPAKNKVTALLTSVRAARHEGYDRVVFQFANTLPGYDVRYVKRPVHQDGSGKVVRVNGTYVVQIRMLNALDADLTRSGAPRTYTGPTRFSPRTPEIAELVRTGGFEAVLTWAVGLHDRVDFRVSALKAPARLVVDFRNH
jgi:hypothetical protein